MVQVPQSALSVTVTLKILLIPHVYAISWFSVTQMQSSQLSAFVLYHQPLSFFCHPDANAALADAAVNASVTAAILIDLFIFMPHYKNKGTSILSSSPVTSYVFYNFTTGVANEPSECMYHWSFSLFVSLFPAFDSVLEFEFAFSNSKTSSASMLRPFKRLNILWLWRACVIPADPS